MGAVALSSELKRSGLKLITYLYLVLKLERVEVRFALNIVLKWNKTERTDRK
jgi:hypothetical protein